MLVISVNQCLAECIYDNDFLNVKQIKYDKETSEITLMSLITLAFIV